MGGVRKVWVELGRYGWSLERMGGVWKVWAEFGGYGWSLEGMGGVRRVWVDFGGYGWSLGDRVSSQRPISQWTPRGERDKVADSVFEARVLAVF